MSNQDHWQAVYSKKQVTDVSWFRPHLDQSLALIKACGLSPNAHIVDVGGGGSTLVDDLLDQDFVNLTVIDLAAAAFERSRKRLGERADGIRWIVGDATTPLLETKSIDLWHDRAVFHFLTDETQRDAYQNEVLRCVRPAGHVLIGAFATDGPERCSGLTVCRYSPAEIADIFTPEFELVETAREIHKTPSGGEQAFSYALMRRIE